MGCQPPGTRQLLQRTQSVTTRQVRSHRQRTNVEGRILDESSDHSIQK